MRRRHGGRRPRRHPERGGQPDDPVRRGLHQERGAARRAGGQAPGGDQPPEHDLFDQALHGPEVLRGPGRDQDGPLPGRGGAQRRRPHPRGQQGLVARGDLRDDPRQAEGGRGGLPRREGHARRHHGARVLQRLAAAGDQGRRTDRRPHGRAARQRADGRRARLRSRQEEGRDDRRLRLRRRNVRHLDSRGRRGRRRGQGDQRRHAPRRRQHRPADHRLDPRRVQEGPGRRPVQGPDGDAAPQGVGGEGQDRAVERDGDGGQPPVHHRRRVRSEAPPAEAVAREARAARRGDRREVGRARASRR